MAYLESQVTFKKWVREPKPSGGTVTSFQISQSSYPNRNLPWTLQRRIDWLLSQAICVSQNNVTSESPNYGQGIPSGVNQNQNQHLAVSSIKQQQFENVNVNHKNQSQDKVKPISSKQSEEKFQTFTCIRVMSAMKHCWMQMIFTGIINKNMALWARTICKSTLSKATLSNQAHL